MSLKDQIAVIGGGYGIVGSGIAIVFLREGAKVWIPGRDESKFNEFKNSIDKTLQPNLKFFKCDLTDEKSLAACKDEILKQNGKINHAASSIGAWWEKAKLSDTPVEEFEEFFHKSVLSHFLFYKTFAKLLSQQPKSTYTFITGASAESTHFMPNASLIPPLSAATYGLRIAAVSEFKDHPNLAIIEFRLAVWIRKQADSNFSADDEVGHDYIGKFFPKFIAKHKSEIYKLPSRTAGDKLYNELSN